MKSVWIVWVSFCAIACAIDEDKNKQALDKKTSILKQIVQVQKLVEQEQDLEKQCADARDDSYDSIDVIFYERFRQQAAARRAVQEQKLAQLQEVLNRK